MDSSSPIEEDLISKLESESSIYASLRQHLYPVTRFKPSSSHRSDETLIRQLQKQFLRFISQCLKSLRKRLVGIPKYDKTDKIKGPLIVDLFNCYQLCVHCFCVLSTASVCTPLQCCLYRLQMIRCYELHEFYNKAEDESFELLTKLPGVQRKGDKILPVIGENDVVVDTEMCPFVLEIVSTLINCAAMTSYIEDSYFRKILKLIDEVKPWISLSKELSSNTMLIKFHTKLAGKLGRCALKLVGYTSLSNQDLVTTFCNTAIIELTKSSRKLGVFQLAQELCFLLLNKGDYKFCYIRHILRCLGSEMKVQDGIPMMEFVNVLRDCVHRCSDMANAKLCRKFALYLNETSDEYKQPVNSILRLYAAGLLINFRNLTSGAEDFVSSGIAKFECLMRAFEENSNILTRSPPLLGSLLICRGANDKDQPFGGLTCTPSASDCETTMQAAMPYRLIYIEALDWLCMPLAQSINFGWEELQVGIESASVMAMLSTAVDAFHEFCRFILHSRSPVFETNDDKSKKSITIVFYVTLAALTLSIRANYKLQESTQLTKHIIASKWADTVQLKYISNCLNNIAISFYKDKQLKEASRVLNLACKASWLCINHQCGNSSEGTLKEFAMQAYIKSGMLLDILSEDSQNLKVRKKLIKTLKNWSDAKDLFEKLPAPIYVVKHWVKIKCKHICDFNERVDSPSLYSTLSSVTEFSKRNIGTILEQELTAYEEMFASSPEFCLKMQLEIMNILLQHIYITPNSCFQKAQILVRKGKALRVCSRTGLLDCIRCFSEAISIMKKISDETSRKSIPIQHELCVTHCLRALRTQEADPHSEQIFEDIKSSLSMWLAIFVDCSEEEGYSALFDNNTSILVYNIIDLIHLKGFMELLDDAYALLMKIYKLKCVSMAKWVTLLWESKRLSHPLCVSPINEPFFLNSSNDEFSDLSKIDFWIQCLERNQSSSIGFKQNYNFLFVSSHRSSCDHDSIQVGTSITEVQNAARKLSLNVPVSSHNIFLAGNLYGDLSQKLVASGKLIEVIGTWILGLMSSLM